MAINASLVSFCVLVLAITLTLSSAISFAEDEHASESQEDEKETHATAEKEHQQTEEHSSHEGEEAEHETEEEPKHEHIRETEEGSHVHASTTAEAAQWVGVGTLLAAGSVFGIKMRSTNKLAYKNVVLILAVGAGIIHLLLVPDHLVDVGTEHGVFFAIVGTAQIGFGSLFIVRPVRKLAIVGAAGSIGVIILYFVTRIEGLPEPFGAPEGIDQVGIITKIAEMSLVAILLYLATRLLKAKPAQTVSAG